MSSEYAILLQDGDNVLTISDYRLIASSRNLGPIVGHSTLLPLFAATLRNSWLVAWLRRHTLETSRYLFFASEEQWLTPKQPTDGLHHLIVKGMSNEKNLQDLKSGLVKPGGVFEVVP